MKHIDPYIVRTLRVLAADVSLTESRRSERIINVHNVLVTTTMRGTLAAKTNVFGGQRNKQ